MANGKDLFVISLKETDKTKLKLVGGKGANLGELASIKGINVPEGFCVSTEAFKKIIEQTPLVNKLLNRLSQLTIQDRDKITGLSAEIRGAIEAIHMPQNIEAEVTHYLSAYNEKTAWAIRSSATAEDLPTASFAGQQDSYLNVSGTENVLKHTVRCWASLFTERAIIYRLQNGFDHRKVFLCVVIQKMIFPSAAGIMFTADPVSSNRKTVSVDASFGLGEAMVSGIVNADNYKVHNGRITDKRISAKKLAVFALPGGGTKEQTIEPERQNTQVLNNEKVLELERMGRKIEEHFACPQDIEWCLANDTFYIVQSRPITTLYPIPEVNDLGNHVYVSVGHQQMMTDAMKPLGLSLYLLTTRAPMCIAGGRLFVDVSNYLASADSRQIVINTLGQSDPLIKDALITVAGREDIIASLPEVKPQQLPGKTTKGPPYTAPQTPIEYDPAFVSELIKSSEASIEELKQKIQTISGTALFDFIVEDIQELRKILFNPQSLNLIKVAMDASSLINEKIHEWLGEKNVADTLSQSVPNNITSEMGLALLDVADVIRPYPEVIAYLQNVTGDDFTGALLQLNGGKETLTAVSTYLNKYGMRCAGEIDLTKTRWSEKPLTLVPIILSNIKNFGPGESKRKFEQGKQEALKKEKDLLQQLAALPDGEKKIQETKRMIARIRDFIGYREYPKYGMVTRYFVYKQAILKEALQLLQAGVIHKKEDVYYLTFEELREVVRTQVADQQIILRRKEEYRLYKKLIPPRVMTSDGEIIAGKYKREGLPIGAMVGLAVSAGLIEGRARVIVTMEEADLEEGDILVTTFTDPSWTPLFVSIKGLVTEVGGLMTHGAVIAREYGLPAVVGVENATRLIKNGQQIRVHGTEGFVEIL